MAPPPKNLLPFSVEVLIGLSVLIGALSVLIAIPLQGIIIRYRAQYTPRGIQLPEDGRTPSRRRDTIGFLAMFSRVKRTEGWGGLYKGAIPMLLAIASTAPRALTQKPLSPSNQVYWSILRLPFSLAFLVIITRAVTTSRRLPWLSPRTAYRALFSHTERDNPLFIPFGPNMSLFKLGVFQLLLGIGLQFSASAILKAKHSIPTLVLIAIAFLALYTIILSPMEVILVRLANQRVGINDTPNNEPPPYSASGEIAIAIRDNDDPYIGVIDCWRKIRQEEGWGTLYRGWWLVLLSGLAFIGASFVMFLEPKWLHVVSWTGGLEN